MRPCADCAPEVSMPSGATRMGTTRRAALASGCPGVRTVMVAFPSASPTMVPAESTTATVLSDVDHTKVDGTAAVVSTAVTTARTVRPRNNESPGIWSASVAESGPGMGVGPAADRSVSHAAGPNATTNIPTTNRACINPPPRRRVLPNIAPQVHHRQGTMCNDFWGADAATCGSYPAQRHRHRYCCSVVTPQRTVAFALMDVNRTPSSNRTGACRSVPKLFRSRGFGKSPQQ
jgi:hypothetical protein